MKNQAWHPIKTYWLLSLLALAQIGAPQAVAQAPGIKPEPVSSFTYSAEIELNGPGPFHQLTLPLAVYQGIQGNGLSELRIFNQQGEPVPHALLRADTPVAAQDQTTKVPLFPIFATADDNDTKDNISLSVQRNNDGTLISLNTTDSTLATDSTVVRGVVLDTSRIKGKLRSLQLAVGTSSIPFHAFSIETSNDLQHWRLLKANAQLVQLEHEGQRIEKNSVDLQSVSAKYLRLLWLKPKQAPEILSATLSSSLLPTAAQQPQKIWSRLISPTTLEAPSADKHVYDYQLQGYLPLEQLRIELAQTNTLAPIKIQRWVPGRSPQTGYWINLKNTVAYRLQSPQGDVRSPDIDLDKSTTKRLRFIVDDRSGGLGSGAPKLQIGFVPHALVFLTRGDGPFTLNWGTPTIKNTALAISTLVPDYQDSNKFSPSHASVLLDTLRSNKEATTKNLASPASNKGVLWFVLIIGVLVLATMTWMLIQQIKQTDHRDDQSSETPPPNPPSS